jgi:threonine dehydrogenase-like Zn-dependent dehydrogenase
MRVIGSFSYSTSAWTRVVRLLEEGLVELDPIVTHRFAASRFEDAFEVMDNRDGVVAKVLLEHVA